MPTISQISNSPNLFVENGQRIQSERTVNNDSVALTDQEEAEELQQQFLQILLTQLQNQNPLDPVDTTEYTNQLVQYSSLEQQIDTNLSLTNILESLQASSSFNAFSYIGNSVELATRQTTLDDGVADWTYALAGNADSVEVTIVNQNGTQVYQEQLGGQSSGSYGFSFNSSETSVPISDGDVLTISIDARTNEGVELDTDVVTNVVVDTVETDDNGDILLRSGGLFFGLTDIQRISDPRTASNNNENDSGTATS